MQPSTSPVETLESVVIRFAGDSGDGMQLTGTQFTNTCIYMCFRGILSDLPFCHILDF